MIVDQLLHGGLAGIMCRGLDAVPTDPQALLGYLRALRRLLWEKANEPEPCCPMGGGAREVETLLHLQDEIGRKAAAQPAGTIGAVLDKLAIWECIAEEAEDETEVVGAALIRSVIADLHRLDSRSR
jgi:hypothetical protein